MIIALLLAIMCSSVMVTIGILIGYEMARRTMNGKGEIQTQHADQP